MSDDAFINLLDAIDAAHSCLCTHRTASADFHIDGRGFSAYSCPACIPMIAQAVHRCYGPDYGIVTVAR